MNTAFHADADSLRALCAEISMPQEAADATANAMKYWNPDWIKSAVEPHFHELFSAETGDAAFKAIEALPKQNGSDGLDVLAVYLTAALRSAKLYEEQGIARDIFTATMMAFTRFVKEHHVSYGKYGFDRGFWTYRQLSLSLFRLGTLEFERKLLGKDASYINGASPDDWALSVHIPSGSDLSSEEIHASYRFAASFFAEKYPETKNGPVICNSWLLSPTLKELLPGNSKILYFQSGFTILHENPEGSSYQKWVFKRKYERAEDLPETTSLARAIKARLLAGGQIGEAFGEIKGFWERYE